MPSKKGQYAKKIVAVSKTGKKVGRPRGRKNHRPKPLPGIGGTGHFEPKGEAVLYKVVTDPNLSLRDKAALLKLTVGSVCYHKRRIAAGLPLGGARKAPQQPSQAAKERAKILKFIPKYLEKHANSTATEVQGAIHSKLKLLRHRNTVQTYMKELGFTSRTKAVSPALYKPADRLAFAKKTLKWIKARKNKDGTNKFVILFTDEAWMGAKDVKKRQWVSNHTKEILTRRMERWAPKVHSWGALWDGDVYVTDLPLAGKGPRKGLSGADFLKHFKVHMTACLARVRKQFPRKEIVVVMDGAGVHNTAKEWLRQKKIGLVEPWPAHSPDLNPIENGWSYMKRRMGLSVQLFKNTKANREKIRELRSEVVEALDPKVCSSLALSFERRLERVVELGGEYTGY